MKTAEESLEDVRAELRVATNELEIAGRRVRSSTKPERERLVEIVKSVEAVRAALRRIQDDIRDEIAKNAKRSSAAKR